MDKEALHKIIEQTQPNICQVYVYKDNKNIYSDTWNNYKATDCVHVMSVTKSIVSLLIGIAIDNGFIKDVDQKVLSFFPDYQVKRGEKTIQDVTIKHLLTMRAPYKCKGDPWTKVCTSPNWTYASLDFLGGRKGLTDEFNYQTVCLHILTGILYQATKLKTTEFANKYLFEQIGILPREVYYAETAEEHKQFTISKAPKEKIWFSDPMDISTPGYGLCLSAEEMAKIELLCLNNGRFNGKQIISESWIKEMTNPRNVENKWFRGMKYGYLWWIIHPEKNIYAAIGNSGNVIYVEPNKNIVVSVASSFKPTVFDRVDFIENTLLKNL